MSLKQGISEYDTHCAECTCCVLRIKAPVTSRGAIWVSTATNTSDSLYDGSSFCSWHFRKPFSLVKFCTTPTFAHVTPNVFTTHDLRNPAVNDSEKKKKVTDLQYDYAPKQMDLQKCLMIKFRNDVQLKLSFFRSIPLHPQVCSVQCAPSSLHSLPGHIFLFAPENCFLELKHVYLLHLLT